MLYIALEYLTYVFVVTLLGTALFATSTLVLLSQEGAKHVAATSRRVVDRTVHLAEATLKSAASLNLPYLNR